MDVAVCWVVYDGLWCESVDGWCESVFAADIFDGWFCHLVNLFLGMLLNDLNDSKFRRSHAMIVRHIFVSIVVKNM